MQVVAGNGMLTGREQTYVRARTNNTLSKLNPSTAVHWEPRKGPWFFDAAPAPPISFPPGSDRVVELFQSRALHTTVRANKARFETRWRPPRHSLQTTPLCFLSTVLARENLHAVLDVRGNSVGTNV